MTFNRTLTRGLKILEAVGVVARYAAGELAPDEFRMESLKFALNNMTDEANREKLKAAIRELFPDTSDDLIDNIDLGLRIARGIMKFSGYAAVIMSGNPQALQMLTLSMAQEQLARNQALRENLLRKLYEDGDFDPDDPPPSGGGKMRLPERKEPASAVAPMQVQQVQRRAATGFYGAHLRLDAVG